MTKYFLTIIALAFLFFGLCCKDEPTKPSKSQIQLTVEDASCTDAWLKLQVGADITNRTVTLKRDNVELWTRTINATETAIIGRIDS